MAEAVVDVGTDPPECEQGEQEPGLVEKEGATLDRERRCPLAPQCCDQAQNSEDQGRGGRRQRQELYQVPGGQGVARPGSSFEENRVDPVEVEAARQGGKEAG